MISIEAQKIYNQRTIFSTYYDNDFFSSYKNSEEGVVPRKKIRLRSYNSLSHGENSNFELKISSQENRFKISKKIKNVNKLENYLNSGYLDKTYGICKPILNVSYLREYFKMDDVRITLDSDIIYKLYNSRFIKKDLKIVAELKTSINKNLDELNEVYPFQEIRFSKYCNGLELFNKF